MSTTITIPFTKRQDGSFELDRTSLPTDLEVGTGKNKLTPAEWDHLCHQVDIILQPMPLWQAQSCKICCFCPAVFCFLLTMVIVVLTYTVTEDCDTCFMQSYLEYRLLPVLIPLAIVLLLMVTPGLYLCISLRQYLLVMQELDLYLAKESEKRVGVSFHVISKWSPKCLQLFPTFEKDFMRCIISVPTPQE